MSQTLPIPESPSGLNTEKPTWLDALLLFGILCMMLLGIGRYGLYEPHEAHFAGVGREMVTRHDWIVPHLNGGQYLNKPPLMYWMIALSYTICGGFSEFAARLPLALVAWCGCVLSWNWARQLWGLRAGRFAAVMLMVSVGWYLFGHQLMIEMLLCVLYVASMYFFWKATLDPERLLYWVLFYVTLGLNVLAKGPVGLVFAGVAVALFALIRRNGVLVRTRPVMGVLLVTGVCAPWISTMEHRVPGYLWYALMNENINRALDRRWPPDFDVVKVSAPVFVLAAMVWLVPWSLLTPQVMSFAWKNGKPAADTPVSRPVSDGVLLLAISALVPILFFVPIPARLVYYQLPMLPPFIILAAGWWALSGSECYTKGRRAAALSLLLVGAVVFSAGFWLPEKLQGIPDLVKAPPTIDYVDNIAFLMGAALLVGGAFLFWRKVGLAMAGTTLLICIACVYNIEGFVAFDAVRSSKHVVEALREKVGPECVWISEGSKEIGTSAGSAFYLGTDASGQSRGVLIVKHPETDTHRAPPRFPGGPAKYLVSDERVAEIWQSNVPAIFISDFQRKNDTVDPLHLPPGEVNLVPGMRGGNRRIYANAPAWKLLNTPK